MQKLSWGLIGLLTIFAAVGCVSKKEKVAELRQQCHEVCKKKQQAYELCQAFCKQEKVEDCEETYCATPQDRFKECTTCCDEKGSEDEFVLGSCLSQGELSEVMTPEKIWGIWKKMIDDRVEKEKKAKEEQQAAEHLAEAAKTGWHVSFEEADDGKVVGVVLVKKALVAPAGAKEGVLPDLILRCGGGELEAYVHVATKLGGKGKKTSVKLGYDGRTSSEKMVRADTNDTLIFGAPTKSLKKMLNAKKLSVEFPAAAGKATVEFELAGLEQTLEPHAKECGF